MLNWTLESVITLVSGIPMILGILQLIRLNHEHKDRLIQLLALTWTIHTLYMLSFGLGYLFLNHSIIKSNSLLLASNVFLITYLFDYMDSGELDPLKSMVATTLVILLLYSAFFTPSVGNYIWPNGELSFTTLGQYRVMISLCAFYMGLLYTYYAVKIYRNVPENLKIWGLINLIGVLIFSYIVTLLFVINITNLIPGIATLMSALGATLSMYAFIQSPQLIYVLPFTTHRLIVIDSTSGTTLYSHKWTEVDNEVEQLSDDLISSALSGLNAFATEAIQMGHIQEIIVEEAVLYIKTIKDQQLQFVLIASSMSRILRRNLDKFARLFIHQLIPIGGRRSYIDTTSFKLAEPLIEDAFPYIPTYS